MSGTSLFKGDLRAYFKSKEGGKGSNVENSFLASTSRLVTAAEMSMAEQEVKKSVVEKNKYQKNVPEKIKHDVGKYAMIHSTKSAITKFAKMYPK